MKLYVGVIVIPSIILYTELIDRYIYVPDHCSLEKKINLSSVWHIKIYVLKLLAYRLRNGVFETFLER